LTTLTIDPAAFGATREEVRKALEAEDIESRPVWKPMHLQPLYRDAKMIGGGVSARIFEQGLCLPSGSSLTAAERDRVIEAVRSQLRN
jgi:dTDP-4-amino-4,6-dideoxygalactose transaminase